MRAARSFLLVLLVLLAACTREAWRAPMAAPPPDSLTLPALAGKNKFFGPVTITYQLGHDNVATSAATDARKAGQRGGAAATGAGSKATATTTKSGTPWWVYAGLVGLGLVAGWLLRARAASVPGLGTLLHVVPWL